MGDQKPTPGTAEGPYYKTGSPERTQLREKGVRGEKLALSGYVLDTKGRPLAGAWLDFWQADGGGKYDNSGYSLRGRQLTDKSGRYTLETVVPGGYPGRTAHIHLKVGYGDIPALTTQVFFPGLGTNQTDPIFRDELLIEMSSTSEGKSGTFDFVLDVR